MRSILILAALGPVVLAACAEEARPRTLKADQAEPALRELWKSIAPARGATGSKGPDWQMHLTTWLPNEWPPTPQTVWTHYAYGLDVSHDGSSNVAAPIARIERKAGDGREVALIPMAAKLKVIGVHPVRPTAGWRYPLDDEKRVLAQALALTSIPPAGARGTFVSYYQSWRLSHAVIAGRVQPKHRSFFAWLDRQ